MSVLIKHRQPGVAAHRLPSASRRAASSTDPERDALAARIAELERSVEGERRSAERKLSEHRAEATRAIADARAAGRAEAIEQAAERLALLEEAMQAAVTSWRDRLAAMDRLAVELASAALRKMFDDPEDLAGLVTRTIAHHVARLERDGVVGIAVSARDFADDGALQMLAGQAGVAETMIVRQAGLPAGACRIGLRIGAIDLDPVGQWSIIEAALRRIGDEA